VIQLTLRFDVTKFVKVASTVSTPSLPGDWRPDRRSLGSPETPMPSRLRRPCDFGRHGLDQAGKPLYRPGSVLLAYYLLGFSFLLVHYLHDGFFFCRKRYLRDS
jgi:hypothetical protein